MKSNKDPFPGSTMFTHNSKFNPDGEYFEQYTPIPDSEITYCVDLTCPTGIDIPYNGQILRIQVSEWGTVELLNTTAYSS